MAARQSYLPALAEQALSSFEHVLLKAPGGGGNGGGGGSAGGGSGGGGVGGAAGGGATPWFEFGDAPLSWALPCGVLYDIVAPPPPPLQPSAETEASSSSSSSSTGGVGDGAAAAPAAGPPLLPWALTVHYRDAPAALLPAWGGVSAARGAYFTSLKARRPAIHSLPSFAPATFAQPLYLPWMSDLCDQADARYITLQTNGKRRHTKTQNSQHRRRCSSAAAPRAPTPSCASRRRSRTRSGVPSPRGATRRQRRRGRRCARCRAWCAGAAAAAAAAWRSLFLLQSLDPCALGPCRRFSIHLYAHPRISPFSHPPSTPATTAPRRRPLHPRARLCRRPGGRR